ncbi:MAG: GuaB3 family IMP dehydrogenase-related protein [Acidimicrobiales bacterium]|nr:GuaB3 family IMP dehydrogenase-related protein [Acidimicrobiales bacterium]
MAEIEIGLGKAGRQAYGFDDIAIVPSRRTRDPEDTDIAWEIDAFRFDLPIMSAAMDTVTSPATAVALGQMGGVGVLHLEGLWTRYEDPEACFAEIAGADPEKATARLQELYEAPVQPELVTARLREIRAAGVVTCGAVTPQRATELVEPALAAEIDLLVIQGMVVSAEHVSRSRQPLNLKTFIRELDVPVIVGGCASYQAALHLMRTGAAGVLVGVGPGAACTTRGVLGIGVPQATAIADARAARMRHLDETGVYVHVIADGGMRSGGDIAKAIVCGADAVMLGAPLAAAAEAPGRGYHWGMSTAHPTLPRGVRVEVGVAGTLDEVVLGPSHDACGRTNLVGALRSAMATCGYEGLKEFQKAELMVAPAMRSEGKELQRDQGVGLG